jgi:hypothetical protein
MNRSVFLLLILASFSSAFAQEAELKANVEQSAAIASEFAGNQLEIDLHQLLISIAIERLESPSGTLDMGPDSPYSRIATAFNAKVALAIENCAGKVLSCRNEVRTRWGRRLHTVLQLEPADLALFAGIMNEQAKNKEFALSVLAVRLGLLDHERKLLLAAVTKKLEDRVAGNNLLETILHPTFPVEFGFASFKADSTVGIATVHAKSTVAVATLFPVGSLSAPKVENQTKIAGEEIQVELNVVPVLAAPTL